VPYRSVRSAKGKREKSRRDGTVGARQGSAGNPGLTAGGDPALRAISVGLGWYNPAPSVLLRLTPMALRAGLHSAIPDGTGY